MNHQAKFPDRRAAGKVLAQALSPYRGRVDSLVLALPRGGVPVAHEVARALDVPMDLWIVRKLGVPDNEDLAMGALAGADIRVFNHGIIMLLDIKQEEIESVLARERAELERRNAIYRHGLPPPDVAGRTVIVVDDGFATGATMRAAVAALRKAGTAWIVAAAPVGAASTCRMLAEAADEIVCPVIPDVFSGVGQWYEDFSQTEDEEVAQCLASARHPPVQGQEDKSHESIR